MISWALAFVGFFLGLSAQVHATGEKCMKELAKTADEKSQTGRYHYRIIESPRAVPEAQIYDKYVQELVRPGGVLEQLGLELPPQVMEFVPPLVCRRSFLDRPAAILFDIIWMERMF
ncbi:MAG: hypothetical protein IPK68_03130 [Bdellovibrionales bacterium]|nr:hypothetical protein [Bdellovibrionales bacterium]